MIKYRKVETEPEKHPENEVRISNNRTLRTYLVYINGLFEEKKLDTVVLRGTGFVISKCTSVADLVRRRIKGLHEIVEFGSVEITDTYEPIEEGLDEVVLKRKIPYISIKLSKNPLPTDHPGYHEPLPESEVTPFTAFVPPTGFRARGRGRGGFRSRGFRGTRGFRGPSRGGFRRGRGFRGSRRGGFRGGEGYSRDSEGYGRRFEGYRGGGQSYGTGRGYGGRGPRRGMRRGGRLQS